MYLKKVAIKNFRRLKDVEIDFEENETVFVGPNNSGKTSATAAVRSFLGNRDFKIHDFSLGSLTEINAYEPGVETELPSISLDLWFDIDPNKMEFGIAFDLITDFTGDFTQIGIRCSLEVEDKAVLWSNYIRDFPVQEDGKRKKALVDFLAMNGNLKTYFKMRYYSLGNDAAASEVTPLNPKDGRKTLDNLLRVDFVDAQRNIDDENATRSNKLSTAFASYYNYNLEKKEASTEAMAVIDLNNQNLTEHYAKHFRPLMDIISKLGLPSKNDRTMKIVSTLSSQDALRGSTDLFYVDAASQHELPEAYNGLGFKNLVFMAIQIDNFYKRWLGTEENRPSCHMIFIEEPEVHLHAQVQQTFIKQIWQVLTEGEVEGKPCSQLTITTHSSNILDAVDFSKIRYFRRNEMQGIGAENNYPGTEVISLKEFKPDPINEGGKDVTSVQALAFLRKYLRLTHCDLFFADAAILVEGAVEKLLLPEMIDKVAPNLRATYLTILEVGGAYIMRFAGLMKFLQIPYLVITDIDSVDPTNHRKACKTDIAGAVTSNATLKYFFPESNVVKNLMENKEHVQDNKMRFIAYQKNIEIEYKKEKHTFCGRTLEEAFVYENLNLFAEGLLNIGITISDDANEIYDEVWKKIKSPSFKKTEFAMDVLTYEGEGDWLVPKYIKEGLEWLDLRLMAAPDDGAPDA